MMISKEEKMEMVVHQVEPITKKDLRKMFWYSIPFYSCWSMERQAASGCLFTMMPLLKKLYKDQPEKLKESLVRNNELYAIADQFHEFVAGILISMEEQNAKADDFDTSAISNVKVALMGPLAGVGDSFFLGTLRVIAIGIGASLMAQGNPLGMLMFALVWNVPCFLIKYFGTFLGYRLGASFITRAAESGVMQKIMEAAGIIGMMAIGAMSVTSVSTNFALAIGSGDAATTLQSVLDSIMPACASMGLTWGMFALLRRKVHPLILIFGVMIICILLSAIGVF
ncbi:MAG: PTS system mannose/fructose/sorbose family transporter subunit IID [Lachnospiraceae bacterium]|jgi:fructoselysine and glucoselysine-specific PTS system IID component|nr:PTS system mannose/fructose/sorbose family transporter subunit IID [Lachnospiraceae bacterium]